MKLLQIQKYRKYAAEQLIIIYKKMNINKSTVKV